MYMCMHVIILCEYWSVHEIPFYFINVFVHSPPPTSFWTRRWRYSYQKWIPIRWTPAWRGLGPIPVPAASVVSLVPSCSCVWTWCFSVWGWGEGTVATTGSSNRASLSPSTSFGASTLSVSSAQGELYYNIGQLNLGGTVVALEVVWII